MTEEKTEEKKWYVVHTYSGYEQKVKEALEDAIGTAKMADFFGESSYRPRSSWKG